VELEKIIADGCQNIGSCNIDWGKAWQEHLFRSGLKANLARQGICQEDFWQRYGGWQEVLCRNGYPGKILERVQQEVRPDFSVLDIGAGAGAFALPLAKTVRLVTAIEPSAKQAARLREAAEKAQAGNLVVIESPWEDVNLSEIGQHDLVLAAYCFLMEDIAVALETMCLAARRLLVLVHTAGHDLTEPMRSLLGVEPGPDYIYLYNMLYQLGYRADITVLTRSFRIPLDIQMEMFRYNPGLDEEQCRLLWDYLEANDKISFEKGGPWIQRHHKDAVIWVNNDTMLKEKRWKRPLQLLLP
jgi:SAM-dependent methyltransferase